MVLSGGRAAEEGSFSFETYRREVTVNGTCNLGYPTGILFLDLFRVLQPLLVYNGSMVAKHLEKCML